MKKGLSVSNDYIATCKSLLEDTVNFENSSSFTRYDYEDIGKSIGTALNLCDADNAIMTRVIPYLRSVSSIKAFEKDEAEKYYGQPMKFSQSEYGTTGYWWVILAINGYFNPAEFTGWEQLIIPTVNEIEQIMDKELFVDENLGVVPAPIKE